MVQLVKRLIKKVGIMVLLFIFYLKIGRVKIVEYVHPLTHVVKDGGVVVPGFLITQGKAEI